VAYSETSAVILARMIGNVSSDIDTTEGSLTYDALSPTSIELAQQEANLDQVAAMFDLSNLSGDELATRIYQRTGLTRIPATYAFTSVTITGTGTVNVGDLVQTLGGIQFKSTVQQAITTTGNVNVQAVVAGSSGMVPSNQIIQFPVALSGLVSVTNASPTQDGFDVETDAALLQRYYTYIQNPSTGGNIAAFTNSIKAFSGVGGVQVYPTWNGNNTVKLVIIDANMLPPSSTLLAAVQTFMDPGVQGLGLGAAPFGAFTTVAGATANTITIGFTSVRDPAYTDAQRQANVQASLTAYFQSIAFIASSVSYAKIGATIEATAGFLDYSALLVNGGTVNIPLTYTSALTQTPVLGVVTFV